MTTESDLVALLKADAGVAAIASDRVWPGARPQGRPYPSVTVNRISGGLEYADDGEVGLQTHRTQVSCWGLTYSDAKGLAVAVTAALSAVRDVGRFTYITLDNEQDLHEFGANNAEYPHQIAQDWLCLVTS